jgi:uncharacterized protein YegL
MKSKILITLITGITLITCTSNMHAAITMTKARTFAQTAVTYARANKLKTAGMVIGGAIALDILNVGCNKIYYGQKLKKADQLVEKTQKASDAAWEKYHPQANFTTDGSAPVEQVTAAKAALAAWHAAHEENKAAIKERDVIRFKYHRVTLLYAAYWHISKKINKMRGN